MSGGDNPQKKDGMKRETIEVLFKTIAPTTRSGPIERGSQEGIKLAKECDRLARIKFAFEQKKEPSINAIELARLVDLRLRQRKAREKVATKEIVEENESKLDQQKAREEIATKEIVEEIESTLDLVEMCEFMLEARRLQLKDTKTEMSKAFAEINLTKEQGQKKAVIDAESYPLVFHKGLIRMGVPGDSSEKRERAFWEYYKSPFANDDVPLPENDELRKSFKERTRLPWNNARELWCSTTQWLCYWNSEKSKKKSAAGKKSGKARKQRSKSKK